MVVFLFSGCAVMYLPNAQNVPMPKEKNDLTTGITLKDLQVSYSVTNHFAFTVDGFIEI